VLVVGGMAIALLGTDETSHRTCFDYCADKAEIRGGLARHDPTGCATGVGAVEAEANAANHFAHVLLGEVRVGTTRAAGDTVEARLDTAFERVAILDGRLWMHPDDLLNVHVSPPSFESCSRGPSSSPELSARFRSSAGQLVEVAVRPSEVQPLPVAVPVDRAGYFDSCRDELALCTLDIVDFEQGDRAARLLTEEREVRIPRREHLNSISARER
jgi:hypothetical protein